MKIVVLDGHTLNPGDLSWDELKKLGECEVFDRTPASDTVARAQHAEVVLTNKVVLSKEILPQLKVLRYVGVLATGYNVVDIAAAKALNIPVTNIPTYGTESVAQMVMAHLLNLSQRVGHHADTVRAGRWSQSVDFCYWDYPLVELSGLTMGIVGFGRIGRSAARMARAFGMKIMAYDAYPIKGEGSEEVTVTDIETLFRQSDVVSLHCPLTETNKKFINTKLLSLMKKTAFLINTSRGPLIDEKALAEALNNGVIAGAGIDVLETEPPKAGSPLFQAKNCYITPHISWATHAARQRLMNTAVENVQAFLNGKPQNVVNP